MRRLIVILACLIAIPAWAQNTGGGQSGSAAGVGTVTAVSGTPNQIDVATGTTTPAISLDPAITLPGTINKYTLTAPATGATFGIADNKSVSFSNSLIFAGTDGTTMTFPGTSATIARTDAANTFTGHQTIEGVTSTGATGTGKFVFDTGPTLGAITVTSVDKMAITAPATSSTLAVADGKTFTVSNTMTLAGTDAQTYTFPTTSATIARTDAANTFTGLQTFNTGIQTLKFATNTNCANSGGTCASAPTGSISIAAAATTVTVATTQIAANTVILITEDSSLGTKLGVTCNTTIVRTYTITARVNATSFTITTSAAPVTNPACLNYLLIN